MQSKNLVDCFNCERNSKLIDHNSNSIFHRNFIIQAKLWRKLLDSKKNIRGTQLSSGDFRITHTHMNDLLPIGGSKSILFVRLDRPNNIMSLRSNFFVCVFSLSSEIFFHSHWFYRFHHLIYFYLLNNGVILWLFCILMNIKMDSIKSPFHTK